MFPMRCAHPDVLASIMLYQEHNDCALASTSALAASGEFRG